jgi:hypothetical protein
MAVINALALADLHNHLWNLVPKISRGKVVSFQQADVGNTVAIGSVSVSNPSTATENHRRPPAVDPAVSTPGICGMTQWKKRCLTRQKHRRKTQNHNVNPGLINHGWHKKRALLWFINPSLTLNHKPSAITAPRLQKWIHVRHLEALRHPRRDRSWAPKEPKTRTRNLSRAAKAAADALKQNISKIPEKIGTWMENSGKMKMFEMMAFHHLKKLIDA